MVGRQGQHMKRVWEVRKSRETMVKSMRSVQTVLTAMEELTLREIIKKKDMQLIHRWFDEHPEEIEAFKLEPFGKDGFMNIEHRISCVTGIDISWKLVADILRYRAKKEE